MKFWEMLFITLFPSLTLSLISTDIEFSIDYFRYRDVKTICLLVCKKKLWTITFAKQAYEQLIQVSTVPDIDDAVHGTNLGYCLRQAETPIGVLVGSNCPTFDQIMTYASENTLLDSTRKWLILSDNVQPDENNTIFYTIQLITEVVGKLNISIDMDMLLANKGDNQYDLYELYNFGKIQGGSFMITKAATWSLQTGFNYNKLNEYKYYRRWNFQELQMRMISVVSPVPKDFDFKMLTNRMPTPGLATITKNGATILEVIADMHNLRYIHSIADRWVGDFSFNKSQAVVASSIYYRQQDISPVLRYMREFCDKVDFLHPPLTSIETRYYYRIPTYGAGKFENQFLRPLSAGTWICVVGVTGLCALVLLLSAKLERRPSSGQYAVFSVIASICQQFFEENTMEIRRESAARRLTILVTGISCVLIYNYYTSSVVSWLLSGPPPSINSLQELLDSPLELIFEDVGYTRSWLQTPSYYYNSRNADIEDELRKKKVFNKKKDAPLLKTVEEGIWMVKAGGFAYHTEVDNADRLISRTFTQMELCELGSLQAMEKALLYPVLQKNSPYKEFFDWSLLRLLERGIVSCIQQRIASRSVRCEGSSPRALALGGAAPAFLLLAAGYLMATVIMLIERAIWNYKENPSRVFVHRKKTKVMMQHIEENT